MVIAGLPIASTDADILTVCPDGSCDHTSVRGAAMNAADGDVVEVYPGAYQPGPGKAIEIFDKSITIKGIGDASEIVLVGAVDAGVIDIRSTDADAVKVRNLTILGGRTDVGGGIYAQSVDLTLIDCHLDLNEADIGAGVAISGGTATITNCRFSRCDAVNYGGAYYSQFAVVTIENCLFDDNLAPEGAAIASAVGELEIRTSRFVENIHSGGGAIISSAQSPAQYPVLVDNRFCGNGYPPVVGAFVDQDGSNAFELQCDSCLAAPDLVETWIDPALDCNADGLVDSCQLAEGSLDDRNLNDVPDDCETPVIFDVPSVFPTIAAAITAARSGSLVRVAPGVYNERLDLGSKDLELQGDAESPETVVLDGTGLGDSVLVMTGGQSTDTLISGLTFRYGTTGHVAGFTRGLGDGGAIFIQGGSPRIHDCVFLDNAAARGGAIWSDGGDPRIRRCRFSGNESTSNGGAIVAKSAADLVIQDCLVEGGVCGQYGGGLHLRNTTGRVETTTVRTSIAGVNGGGILVNGSGSVALTGCTLDSNAAASGGGGLHLEAGTSVSLQDCLVSGNEPTDIDGTFEDLGGNEIGGDGPQECPADLDGDGFVKGSDLGLLLVGLGTTCPEGQACPADLDGSGEIDGADLGLLLVAWGVCP